MSDYISDTVHTLARKVLATPLPPLFSPRPEGFDDVQRRAVCLTLARKALADGSSTYDLIAAADYLDRGYLDDEAGPVVDEDMRAAEAADEEGAAHPWASLDNLDGKAAEKTGYAPTDLRG
ncbi:hypothetical protein [Pseudonocardia sp. D17]|uniref:hypothetical protein n=1 Tax=Pseudonocardia sp. D17 TaxID=882661 RepID=UPI002B3D5A54|nr:hypothetical protein PSD17_56540 [Pseudonocardia sp. D17]